MKKQEIFVLLVPFLLTVFYFSSTSNSVVLSFSCLPIVLFSIFFFEKPNKIPVFEKNPVLTFAEKKKLERSCPPATIFKVPEQKLDFSEQQMLPIDISSPPSPVSKERRF